MRWPAALAAALGALASAAIAQFQLPPATPAPGTPALPELGAPPRAFAGDLKYQYAFGSESDIVYRRDRDLDRRLRDNSLLLAPQVNGIVVYRPAPWLETTLEMILEKEIAAQEEAFVTLPNGEIERPRKRRVSLLVDQAFATVRNETRQVQLHAGRRNYEDERHWLYDTSMDIAAASFRQGALRAEATLGREVLVDLDLAPAKRQLRDRIDTFMLYGDYRGIEDVRLAAYTISRHDRARQEGRPQLLGVRALGRPTDQFNFWTELAHTRGRDEFSKKLSGHAIDAGFTYRYTNLPYHPSVTLGYAFATGDANPNDGRNHEFRQSGLQSNEIPLAGFSKFRIYGEVLDPELSNLQVLTLASGFRPATNVSVEVVYHRYRLDKVAEQLRNSALTAEMNQVDILAPSKDVGRALDIVIGIRRPFGLRRLGVDLRAGWFSPGKAFRRNQGDDENPVIHDAQRAVAMVAKFWW